MEKCMLDGVAGACAELTAELALASCEADKERLITEHVRRMWDSSAPIPDFQPELEWVNVTKPLSLRRDCRQRVVVLDFFTYCCINCYHVLPDLRELETLYPIKDGLVVIGVHSAKFDNEKETSNILSCVQRYGIQHPVVNDPESTAWRQLGIICWPTLLILGPHNKPIFVLVGEGHREELLSYVSVALRVFESRLTSSKLPTSINTHLPKMEGRELKFPGKVALNPWYAGGTDEPFLAISDSGNHRVVVTACSGLVLYVAGGPDAGFNNGKLMKARLDSPQGVCWLSRAVLVVCDTGNHALRTVDLQEDCVELLAGTGKKAQFGDNGGKCMGLQALSSPWDVVLHLTADMDLSVRSLLPPPPAPPGSTNQQVADKNVDDRKSEPSTELGAPASNKELRRVLLVSCAGSHQLWALFLDTTIWWKYRKYEEGTCVCIAGNGVEAARNSSYPSSASFAQPSGLALRTHDNSAEVFVADSESSSVRRVSLASGCVSGLAGGDINPMNLFAFGDADGIGMEAKFQHPLGVAYSEATKQVYVADTYNHKLKTINLSTQHVTTLRPCLIETVQPITFKEPSGLASTKDGKYIYVADTNNHRILIYNVAKNCCEELNVRRKVDFIEPSSIIRYNKDLIMSRNCGTMILKFGINLSPERNAVLSKGAPQNWQVFIRNEMDNDVTDAFEFVDCERSGKSLPSRVELKLKDETEFVVFKLYLMMKLFICEGDVCFTHEFTVLSNIVCRDSDKPVAPYKLMCTINPQRSS